MDLKNNTAWMNELHKINEPSESIIDQIETAVYFSDSRKVPYMPEQVVTAAYDLIFYTGYFTDTCCRWNQKPATRKTWAEFKIYFAEEHRLWQDTQPTSVGET